MFSSSYPILSTSTTNPHIVVRLPLTFLVLHLSLGIMGGGWEGGRGAACESKPHGVEGGGEPIGSRAISTEVLPLHLSSQRVSSQGM